MMKKIKNFISVDNRYVFLYSCEKKIMKSDFSAGVLIELVIYLILQTTQLEKKKKTCL